METGLSVRSTPTVGGAYYWFEEFFTTVPIQFVLNSITLVWRFLIPEIKTLGQQTTRTFLYTTPEARAWKDFVERVLREENLGYSLDEQCGIHFFVDQEFEHNRVTVLRGLDAPRYAGVRTAFEDAYKYLDADPTDTKAAVRSMFESMEILTKLMVDTKNLNKWVVENTLKQSVQSLYGGDDVASRTAGLAFDGFAKLIDGLHNYRHGQGKEETVSPPMSFAIYVLSSGAAFLRWLIEIDSSQQK